MHMVVAVRGILSQIEQFEKDLQAQFFRFPHNNPEWAGLTHVRLSVRPIRLYELVFPEDALKEVIATVRPWGFSPVSRSFMNNIMMSGIRTALQLEPMPEMDTESWRTLAHPVEIKDVEVLGIGIKRDGDNLATHDYLDANGAVIVKKGDRISEAL